MQNNKEGKITGRKVREMNVWMLRSRSFLAHSILVQNKREEENLFAFHGLAITVSVNRDTSTENVVALVRLFSKKDARLSAV